MNTQKHTLPSIIDLDELFATTHNTTVLNDIILDKTTEEIIDAVCDVSADRTDTVARCQCDNLVGNYYEGVKCSVCGAFATQSLFGSIRNELWLEIPKTIKGVLNPRAYSILENWIGTSNRVPILPQLLDMSQPNKEIVGTPFFAGQGLNWFYENFQSTMEYFLQNHQKTRKKDSEMMRWFLEDTGKALWCTKLPILSKLIQPVTKHSEKMRYVDPELKSLLESIFTLGSVLLSERMMKFSVRHLERNFYKVYQEFVSYTKSILENKLPSKPSLLRKHVYGARYHMTGRSVAVPIVTPHDGDEIYLPWRLGVRMYMYHIISVLVNKYHMKPFDAYNRVSQALMVYDHTIDLILQRMIKDCPYKGLPVLMNRNPSLKEAAIQLLFITRVKPALVSDPRPTVTENGTNVPIGKSYSPKTEGDITVIDPNKLPIDNFEDHGFAGSFHEDAPQTYTDFQHVTVDSDDDLTNPFNDELERQLSRYINDDTIEVSPIIITGPNLDFDGDEINLLPIMEMDEVPHFMRMYPSQRILSTSSLDINGGDIKISSQQFVTMSSWLNDPEAM